MGIDYDQLYIGCIKSATQEYDFDLGLCFAGDRQEVRALDLFDWWTMSSSYKYIGLKRLSVCVCVCVCVFFWGRINTLVRDRIFCCVLSG